MEQRRQGPGKLPFRVYCQGNEQWKGGNLSGARPSVPADVRLKLARPGRHNGPSEVPLPALVQEKGNAPERSPHEIGRVSIRASQCVPFACARCRLEGEQPRARAMRGRSHPACPDHKASRVQVHPAPRSDRRSNLSARPAPLETRSLGRSPVAAQSLHMRQSRTPQ